MCKPTTTTTKLRAKPTFSLVRRNKPITQFFNCTQGEICINRAAATAVTKKNLKTGDECICFRALCYQTQNDIPCRYTKA